jgi:hypothetical protein
MIIKIVGVVAIVSVALAGSSGLGSRASLLPIVNVIAECKAVQGCSIFENIPEHHLPHPYSHMTVNEFLGHFAASAR